MGGFKLRRKQLYAIILAGALAASSAPAAVFAAEGDVAATAETSEENPVDGETAAATEAPAEETPADTTAATEAPAEQAPAQEAAAATEAPAQEAAPAVKSRLGNIWKVFVPASISTKLSSRRSTPSFVSTLTAFAKFFAVTVTVVLSTDTSSFGSAK